MLKIGHRGAKGYVAENTMASFQKAIDLNVDGIELDVHLSLDGEIMVIHDETIDRTSDETGFVNHKNACELKQLGIPTLEEVITLVNQKCTINIEIKDAKATNKVVALIEKFISENRWNQNKFQISSFDWEVLERVSNLNSTFLIGVLTNESIENALTFAQKINAYSINPFYKLIDKEKVTLLHQNGFLVFPFTGNEPHEIEWLKSLDVDGIISDFPDRI